ncbi:hypothetical protein [Burkholderia pseudomallei]|uniref:hypothetical protein n=1 Tax=Burkholderia pseudomallei TaxID=28450 RepID=UPI000F2030B6|nr:hypothetical protein [Burkholderia pseudomallei]VBL08242.1 Uncharacterised protein [Burkholderia pseudomallei]
MLFQFLAVRFVHGPLFARRRRAAAARAPSALAMRPTVRARLPFIPRPAGCAIVAATAGAVALVALLSASGQQVGLNQAIRVSWWFS